MLHFYVTAFSILITYGTVYTRADIDYLRGSNGFLPCTHSADPTRPGANILICDVDASREFGDTLPIIDAEGIPLSVIRISASPQLTRCPLNAFFATDAGGFSLQILEINGAHLFNFEPGCFNGLANLVELRIFNAKDGENQAVNKGVDIFKELEKLESLETLHLISVDLSSGIHDRALKQVGHNLRLMHLERNRLTKIGDLFLPDNNVLKELRIEGQPEGWKLLENADKWGRNLWAIESISFTGSKMQPSQSVVKMHFGELVNRRLTNLNLDGCSITHLTYQQDGKEFEGGVDLSPLGWTLKYLSLNRNLFRIQGPNGTALDGLRWMRNLRILSMNQNAQQLYQMPAWFGSSYSGLVKLRELQIRESGVRYISANAFPPSTEVLHLSDNGLVYVDEAWADNLYQLKELHMNGMRLAAVYISGRQADWARAFRSLVGTLELLSMHGCQLQAENLNAEKDHANGVSTGLRLGLHQLRRLKTLILNNNELTHIPPGLFQKLLQLRHLSLAGNQLQETGVELTWGTRQPIRLQRLDLRRNQLTTLNRCGDELGFGVPLEDLLPKRPVWIAGEIDNMQWATGRNDTDLVYRLPADWFGGLSLTDNPLICDCRLAWLRQYASQVQRQVAQSQTNHVLPKGYEAYEREALDFTCAESGLWKHRRFLSLTPMDLYTVEHIDCRERPDIYGSKISTDRILPPCAQLQVQSEWQNDSRTRMAIFSGLLLGRTKNVSRTILEEETDGTNLFGLSTGALVIVMVAGALLVCFVLFSTIIIIWLCIRVQRQDQRYKYGTSRSHTSGAFGWCCPTDRNRGPRLCVCCSRQPLHSEATTHDSYVPYTLASKISGNHNDHLSINSTESHSVHDEPGDSYYSQLSDNMDTNVMMFPNRGRGTQQRPLRRRRRQVNVAKEKEHIEEEKGIQHPTWIENNKKIHRPHVSSNSVQNTRNLSASEHPLKAAISLGALELPDHPLPPIPVRGKTTSTIDLRHQSVAYQQKTPWSTTNREPQELDRPESFQMKHEDTMRVLSVSERIRSEYHPVLPWRSESVPQSRRNHSLGKELFYRRISKRFAPARLTRSACPNLTNPNETMRPFEESKSRFQRGWTWLKKRRRRKEASQIDVDGEPLNTGLEFHVDTQMSETLREMQGPDLPKPQFIIEHVKETEQQNLTGTREYLVMCAAGVSDKKYGQASSGKQPDQVADAYVDEVSESDSIGQPKLTSSKVGRCTSKSDGTRKSMFRQLRHKHPNLSDSVYTGMMYDELPPPPPPPPFLSPKRVPITSENRLTHEPVMTTTTKGYINQNYAHRSEEKSDSDDKHSTKCTPPPVAPKPHRTQTQSEKPLQEK